MKSNISVLIVLGILLSTQISFAQKDTIQIKTSSECGTCKKTIEEGLRFTKGVKSSSLDVKSKMVTVVYDSKKTTPEAIRIAITKMGYDADSIPADIKAYNKLEDCCKKNAHNE